MDNSAVVIQMASDMAKLPADTSQEEMREKIHIAIVNDSGFGLANISAPVPSLRLQKAGDEFIERMGFHSVLKFMAHRIFASINHFHPFHLNQIHN
jgi:hypothetical protein